MTPAERQVLQQLMLESFNNKLQTSQKSKKNKGASRAYDLLANYLVKGQVIDFIYGHIMQTEFPKGHFDPSNPQHIERYVNRCVDIGLAMMFDSKGRVKQWVKDCCAQGGQPIGDEEALKNALLDGFLFQGAQTALVKAHMLRGKAAHPIRDACKAATGAMDRKLVKLGLANEQEVKPIKTILSASRDRRRERLEQQRIVMLQSKRRVKKQALNAFAKFEQDQQFCLQQMLSCGVDSKEYYTWMYQLIDNYRKIDQFIKKIPNAELRNEMTDKLEDIDKDYYVNNLHFRNEFQHYINIDFKCKPKYVQKFIIDRNSLLTSFQRVMRDVQDGKVDLEEAQEVFQQIDQYNQRINDMGFKKHKLQDLVITDEVEKEFAGLNPESPSVRGLVLLRTLDEHLTADQLEQTADNMSMMIEDHVKDLHWLIDNNGKITNPEVFAALETMIRDQLEVTLDDKLMPMLSEHLDKLYDAVATTKDDALKIKLGERIRKMERLQKTFRAHHMRLELLRQTCAHHEYNNSGHKRKRDRMEVIGVAQSLSKLDKGLKKKYGDKRASAPMQHQFLDFAWQLREINPYCSKYVGSPPGTKMKNNCSKHVNQLWKVPTIAKQLGQEYADQLRNPPDVELSTRSRKNSVVAPDPNKQFDFNQFEQQMFLSDLELFHNPNVCNYDGQERELADVNPVKQDMKRYHQISENIQSQHNGNRSKVKLPPPPPRHGKSMNEAANDTALPCTPGNTPSGDNTVRFRQKKDLQKSYRRPSGKVANV